MKWTLIFLLSISFYTFSVDNFDLGKKFQSSNSYDSSIFYFNKALSQNAQDTNKAKILLERGKSYQLNQNYEKALIDYNNALSTYKKHKNYNGVAKSYIYIAEFERHLGQIEKAIKYIAKAEIFKLFISQKTLALFYNRKAAVHAQSDGTTEEIVDYSNKSIKISKKYGFKNLEASSYNEIGYVYSHGNDTLAPHYYKKSLEIYRELNDLRSQVHVLSNIARFYQRTGEHEKAIFYCDEGIALAKGKRWYLNLKTFYNLKAVCLEYSGRFKDAYFLSVERMNANLAYSYSQHDIKVAELETQYEVDKKNEQIELEQEKSRFLKKQNIQKENEKMLYILLSVLLALLLGVSFFAYFKIKKTNKLLNKNIGQKEILLQEVHHRVKNNLTVLSSLLYLRSKISVNDETKLILEECQTRIQSMALVHQNLYDVEDTECIDLTHFITQLITESKQIFNLSHIQLQNNINTNNIQFDMSFTIFLGLILNEFITNSFKYGFTPNIINTIDINLSNENNMYKMTYFDSGNGFPKGFDLNKTDGFGFKLIKIMVKQIGGTLSYLEKSDIFILTFTKTK